MPPEPEPSAAPDAVFIRTARVSAFWPCFWLGVLLFALKFLYIPLLDDVPKTLLAWGRDIAILSASDVVFAVATGLIAQAAIFFTKSKPTVQRGVWIGYIVFGAGCVVWGVLSLRIAQVLRMPLTYPLLYLAGDISNMMSSVQQVLPSQTLAAIIGAPSLYLFAVTITEHLGQFERKWVVRFVQVLLLASIGCWFYWARERVHGYWGHQEDARALADNPHAAFVSSFFTAIFHGGAVTLHEKYPPDFVNDFKTAGDRGGGNQPTTGIPRGAKNVIVVICESVCTQHLSLYGSKFKTWPRMEEEAANAIVFNRFYSHLTNTANSLAALTLSIYPPLSWRELTVEQPGIPGTTVAQVLKVRGYRTAFISAGNNDFSNQGEFLKNRGYDVIQDARDIDAPAVSSWGTDDKAMVGQVLRFIDGEKKKPFYVFAWTQGTHHPYEPGADWESIDFLGDDKAWGDMGWELNRYLNALHEADKALGNLLDGLRKRGLADDTLVIITGDHGQAFGRPHKTYFHSGRVYQEDVNVPLIVWNPKLFKNAPRSDTIGAHLDLAPTVLDLLGCGLPASFQGRSLFDPARPPRAYFYGAMDNYILGVREDDLKYIYNATRGREELYNLAADPEEKTNLAAKQKADSQRLRQRLGAWMDYEKKVFEPEK